MAYNIQNVSTAGKVTVLASLVGLLSFILIFTLNLKNGHLEKVEAQSLATTTVTVLNTPPSWTVDAQEEYESSSLYPTNAGGVVSWVATGTDSNSDPYYLLICKTSASPTPNSGAAPTCDLSTNQWAISASTTSGQGARAATTTAASYAEVNAWFAWICDYNVSNPRCNATVKQGTGTTSSPFEVNHRPTFTLFSDNSPTLPGSVVTFYSTSSDSDTSGTPDSVKLYVCSTNSFSTSTQSCTATTLASSTATTTANASSTYTVVIPTQDQNYTSYGFIVDNHGFEASGGAQGTDSVLTVSNASPSVSGATISLNGGTNMILTNAATQTPGFTIQYTVTDNNSCINASSQPEVAGYQLGVFRSGIGSTTCSGTNLSSYNPNNCYPGIATTTGAWNLSCTASTTSCTGATDTTKVFDCTFPLWYVADPTDGTSTSTQFSTQNWSVAVSAFDDNGASSTLSTTTSPVEVVSFLSFSLNTLSIPYGALQPGSQTDPIVATTTISATGNVGLDQRLSGESMCTTYTTSQHCPVSATSTIPESEQVYATSSVTYAQGVALSSTTAAELELNVLKPTATSTQTTGSTYWGIRVPGVITLAGSYKGENTFVAVVGESAQW